MQTQFVTVAPAYTRGCPYAARKFQEAAWGASEHPLQQSGPDFTAFEEHDREDAGLLAERLESSSAR